MRPRPMKPYAACKLPDVEKHLLVAGPARREACRRRGAKEAMVTAHSWTDLRRRGRRKKEIAHTSSDDCD